MESVISHLIPIIICGNVQVYTGKAPVSSHYHSSGDGCVGVENGQILEALVWCSKDNEINDVHRIDADFTNL